eukprot:comp20563_c0_seq2/m.41703 comp20563_c0_seq2/g.41703  ORF comp20563_c0_seq2/g.41703 comp20563_c0_seq2/m.41703 type:complete len:358 (-) comp20563_c0_seq2:28-1101(-)
MNKKNKKLLITMMCCAAALVLVSPVLASGDSLDHLVDPAFYEQIAPTLHIGSLEESTALSAFTNVSSLAFNCNLKDRQRFIDRGYIGVRSDRSKAPEEYRRIIGAMHTAVLKFVEAGLPPVFIFAYEEPWRFVLEWAQNCLQGVFMEDYIVLPALWAWHVSQANFNREDSMGWKPHRDRLDEPIPASPALDRVRSFSLTTVTSVWLALSEATPTNGCIYIVPKDRDAYARRETNSDTYVHDADNPGGHRIRFPLQAITALPAQPGDWFTWDQRLLHWGGISSEDKPRISLAFEVHRASLPIAEYPAFKDHIPSFRERMAIILYGVTRYTHMYDMGDKLLAFAKQHLADTDVKFKSVW